ncbi:hypothetical protein BD311DRAFT_661627 [Dichomitus squalens]|uniref:Uncharacterized protein n=1 Tax=Dichomitus squalens TaxID=114155 RepID=A0A4Q9MP48_9APHY|nr:hypothetical protein BD311DRAFT_661627 [Dichomitus squalens]
MRVHSNRSLANMPTAHSHEARFTAVSGADAYRANLALHSLVDETTVVSEHGSDAYEKASYYNGITRDDDHPVLVYRSDYLTTPFPKPDDRFPHIPVKSLRGVFDTPLNQIWGAIGPQVHDIVKARNIQWSSIDTARFDTHGPLGEEDMGSLGPVVIWIDVLPGSTPPLPPDTAHDVSQQILDLLRKNGVEGFVVEWREAVAQRLAGSPLLQHADSFDPTHYVRRFLTALHCVPLTAEDVEEDDSQGTLTLWFTEGTGDDGKPSDKVYGLSNCHVLRKNTALNFSYKRGAAKNHAASEWRPRPRARKRWIRGKLDEENEAIAGLEQLHDEVTKSWIDLKLRRNIGHVVYAPAIKVDEGRTGYTADWGVFWLRRRRSKVPLKATWLISYTPLQLRDMFHPGAGGRTAFKYPEEGKLKIHGCATKEDLAVPTEFDSQGQCCLMVGKDGNTTGLTVGRYAGLESFVRNAVGVESMELAIYNSGNKAVEAFSAKRDSGSFVWHMKDGKAYIVGQLHSRHNKGGSTSNHVTYCTPGWWLLTQIQKKYKNANLYPDSWPVREQLQRLHGSVFLRLVLMSTELTEVEACAFASNFMSSSPLASSLLPCAHSLVLIVDCESFPSGYP